MMASDPSFWGSPGEAMTARLLRAGLCSGSDAPELAAADWLRVADHAGPSGLAGLVHTAARNLNLPIPPEEEERLRFAAAQVGTRNLHIQAKLAPIVAGFNRAGVELLALKGIVLSRQVYGRCDLRPMADVDLMLRPAEAQRGCRILENLGCSRGEDLVREDFFPRFYYEVEYHTPDVCPVKLDVHARPFRPVRYRRTVPDEGLWEGSERMAVGDAWVRVPSAERMLIHLCCHAACHGAGRLLWLLDIKMYADARADRIDWAVFCRVVADWRLAWPVLRALDRVADVFGAAVPDGVRTRLAALPVTWRDRLALWQAPRDTSHPCGRLVVDALTGGGRGDGVEYMLAVAFPQRSHMTSVYGGRHFGWLACAHGWRLLRIPARVIRRVGSVMAGRGLRRVLKALN